MIRAEEEIRALVDAETRRLFGKLSRELHPQGNVHEDGPASKGALLLTPEKSFKRKIQEIILARRLEHALTKQEIITLYVNQINFGRGRYGVQEAARYYFGKDIAQGFVRLALAEAILFAQTVAVDCDVTHTGKGERAKS